MTRVFRTLVICLVVGAAPANAGDSIVAEGVVGAPVATVWHACATTEGLRSWLAPHADIDLRVDGRMRSNYNPDGSLDGPGTTENRVLAYEPQRTLSIKVSKAPEQFPFISKIGDMWTVLYFQPTAEGTTTLRIVGMGFGANDESRTMKAFFEQGDAYTLAQLQKRFSP